MKKLFIAIMAVAAAVSCSQELTVDAPKGAAIAFDNLFVENSTRANDLNANNITDFGVYGFISNAAGKGQIFNNQLVAKSGDAFTYSPAQYWVANADYYFAAIAPAAKANTYVANAETPDAGVLSYDNQAAAANVDLLFAYHKRDAVAEIKAAPAAVAFTFDHILSRVKFSFKNGFAEGQNITLDVTNVNITNAIAKGDLALEAGALAADWVVAATPATFNIPFGNAGATLAANKVGTTEHFYLIPANAYEYNVTFDVTIYQAGVKLDTYNRSAKVTVDLLRGNSYELAATLNASNVSDDGENALYPIEFTVGTVNGWENYTGADVTVPEHVVATAAELSAAVAEGGTILLTQDINLDAVMVSRANTYGLFIEKDCVIDGAGYTITTKASRGIAVSGANDVVLKNFNLVASGERGIQVQGGAKSVTIENVTAVAANYTVNLPTSAGATNVTINNCDLKGFNTVNIGAPGAIVNINNTTLRCEDNADESYSVIAVNKDATGAVVTVNGGEIIVTGTKPEGTNGGNVQATNGAINISSTTKGNTTISDRKFAIMYGEYWYSFKTLADAIEKVQNGETIMLTQDATLDTTCSIEKDITLDLNGKTLTIAAKDATVVDLKNYGKMNLINGKIAAGNAEASRRCVYNYGEMTINNVEFVQTYGAKGAAINNEAKMTIENATVNSVYYAIWNSGANAELVVNGGTFNCVGNNDTWKPSNDSVAWCYAVTNRNGAKMTVNGGYFSGNHGVIAAYEGSEVTLNAGTYECFATMSGVSDWVLYAYGDGAAVKYSADCVLKHATKAADACCTTEENGVVTQF